MNYLIIISIMIVCTITAIVLKYKNFSIYDIDICFMVGFIAYTIDMIMCKQLELYYYINLSSKALFSFLSVNFIYIPVSIIAIWLYDRRQRNGLYHITIWSVFFTLGELFLLKPYKVVIYTGWRIIPWSFVTYFIFFSLFLL